MKTAKKIFRCLFSAFLIFNLHLGNVNAQEPLSVELEVVRAFDSKFPVLEDQDLSQVLEEAKRLIYAKFGDDIKITFKDRGVIPLDELFYDKSYRETELYESYKYWGFRYDLQNPQDLTDDYYKKIGIKFLQQWGLDSFKKFYPDKEIKSYEIFYEYLANTYREKINWLLSLRKNGELIVDKNKPYHSYVEWDIFMNYQDSYDIIITNTLIINDYIPKFWPHVILRHAKIGGSAFPNPKRETINGTSLMVSTLEQYGDVKGISPVEDIPDELKNRIFGATYLAHEFGHAFYFLPDFYDHGNACLMDNSSIMDDFKKYNYLINDLAECDKCSLWIEAKKLVMLAKRAKSNKSYSKAGNYFVDAVAKTPENLVIVEYNSYIKKLLEEAKKCFEKDNNQKGLSRVNETLSLLNSGTEKFLKYLK